PETADSILLYAYKKPIFVVDAYTRKLLLTNKIINEKTSYEDIQKLFMDNLKRDYKLYQEYHALIVANGKVI
ncbi:MAG: endonuclease III domain-containing protein, partial [archaeon]